ncbi:hypothetical protein QY97_02435 [Bacillus thermotolerans]|uniref:Uncharacterized protein n=1 Tax=Bacillus thermotolerans TaxID=1221996 RepID=A0A0F5HXY6_BACTR|nr:hypothetical protein QY95_02822 [Bacillus thermotolerans]KKB38526.1 hypothetical protein QY97_02435 [Bacillus thermotolerans]KKB39942.1 hypothetical protein QY96_02675 [Bacillus thermotolerans]
MQQHHTFLSTAWTFSFFIIIPLILPSVLDLANTLAEIQESAWR